MLGITTCNFHSLYVYSIAYDMNFYQFFLSSFSYFLILKTIYPLSHQSRNHRSHYRKPFSFFICIDETDLNQASHPRNWSNSNSPSSRFSFQVRRTLAIVITVRGETWKREFNYVWTIWRHGNGSKDSQQLDNYNLVSEVWLHFGAEFVPHAHAYSFPPDGHGKIEKRIETLPLCSPNSRHNYSTDLLLARCIQRTIQSRANAGTSYSLLSIITWNWIMLSINLWRVVLFASDLPRVWH